MRLSKRHELAETSAAYRAKAIFQCHLQLVFRRIDRLFAGLLVIQWFAADAVCNWVSPSAPAGLSLSGQPQARAAVLLWGSICC